MSEPSEPAKTEPDPSAWEEHVCVRCAKEFMRQRGAPGGDSCPHCGAPASLTTARRDPGKFAPLSTPRGRQKRSRRKRKVHREEDLGWEGGGGKPRAKDGEVSEFLTSTPGVPRGIRLKRVRRKKLPGRWQKLSAKLGVWGIGLIILTSAGLIYLTLHTLFIVASNDPDPADQPIVYRGPDLDTLDEAGVPTIVTPQEKAACVVVANGFYAAGDVEAKLPYVRQPERVRPLMDSWYEHHADEDEQVAEVVFAKKRALDARRFITLAIEFETGRQRIISFEQSDDGDSVLLDWEVSVGYQAMPLADFKRATPAEAVPFRALVKTNDDYRAPFEDSEKYQSVRLTYPGDREFELTGYIDREAPWAAEFLAKLEFGAASVILQLKFSGGATSDAHVEVVAVVHDSWYY